MIATHMPSHFSETSHVDSFIWVHHLYVDWRFLIENSNTQCRRHIAALPSTMARRDHLLWLRFLIMAPIIRR